MKLVKVTGPLDQLNNFISTCCLDGSFHPEQATQYMSASMGYSTLSEENPYAPMLQKIEELIRENDSAPDPTIVGDRSREIQLDDKTSAYIDELDEKLSAMHDEYKELEDQLEQCRNGIAKYEHFTGFDVGLDELFNCKFIKTRFGHMPKESYEKLVAYDDDPYVLFIPCSTDATDYWGVYCAPRERVDEVDSIFAGLNFERLQIPSAVGTVEQVIDQLKSNIEIIEGDLKQLDERAAALWKENRKRCNEIYTKLVDLNTVFEMRRYAACHNKYFFYVGWVLAHDSKAFEKKAEAIENVEVEENDPDKSSGKTPPVKLRNPAIFKPYEYFVDMYGLPSYSDIDVTGFVAITYTLLFGIMFGDLGQGLLLGHLTGSGELRHLTDVGGLGSLSTGVGVHLSIEDHNIDVVAGSQDVIQAAVTDVISPAVAAKDPMTALDKELFFFIQSCAFIALVLIFFQNGRQCFRTFTSAFADVHIIEPILHCCFQISRNLGSQSCFYHFSNTLAGLFYTQVHTQTIFGIIFEKRIRPAGTMPFAVSSIRHGRRTGTPD